MNQCLMVWTTCDDRQVLDRLCDQLVEQQLAACCQISGPITSVYRWQGNVERGEEWLCSIKTTVQAYAQVEQLILDGHSYDEPEIIAVEIVSGSRGYLDWLVEAVRTPAGQKAEPDG